MSPNIIVPFICTAIIIAASQCQPETVEKCNGWISLFNGKDLNGWKASENQNTFRVHEGILIADGYRSHLFYVGPIENGNFKNFELKADVMTKPRANSGIYFHTHYQGSGWPSTGYEVQVNNSHKDWRRTGSLYAISDVKESPAKDNEWFTLHIIVKDKHITVMVNGKIIIDYTEPDEVSRKGYPGMPGRKLSSGTFAIQGHDSYSEVHYKNIFVKPLP